MLEYFKNLLCLWTGEGIKIKTPAYDAMIRQLEDIHRGIQDVRQSLIDDKKMLIKELEKKDMVMNAMIENLPDMLWLKDVSGRYVYANKAIRENLLFCNNPVGKTDRELSRAAKEKFGDRNHTFGEVCGESDLDVLENKYVGKTYSESGLIKGVMLHLEVNKSIVEIGGEIIGVVGSARNITAHKEALIEGGHEDVFKANEFVNKDK